MNDERGSIPIRNQIRNQMRNINRTQSSASFKALLTIAGSRETTKTQYAKVTAQSGRRERQSTGSSSTRKTLGNSRHEIWIFLKSLKLNVLKQ